MTSRLTRFPGPGRWPWVLQEAPVIRRRVAAALAAAAAALLLAGCAAAVSAGPARPSLPVLAMGQWSGVEPAAINFGGASAVTVGAIYWHQWGASQAIGVGSTEYDDCLPDCASAAAVLTPADVLLSQPVGGHFTVLTVTLETDPPQAPAVYTYGSPAWPVGT